MAVSTALAAGQGPVPQTRSMAIVAVAVNDAVNGISGRYVTYDHVGWRPSNASADAAAAGAAHRALTTLYPTQAAALDAAFAASLAAHAISASDPGVAFGEMVAR
jgi:predicted DNA repair protein MutK